MEGFTERGCVTRAARAAVGGRLERSPVHLGARVGGSGSIPCQRVGTGGQPHTRHTADGPLLRPTSARKPPATGPPPERQQARWSWGASGRSVRWAFAAGVCAPAPARPAPILTPAQPPGTRGAVRGRAARCLCRRECKSRAAVASGAHKCRGGGGNGWADQGDARTCMRRQQMASLAPSSSTRAARNAHTHTSACPRQRAVCTAWWLAAPVFVFSL